MPIQVTDHLLNLVKEEKTMLRAELQALKECQIKFLTGAVVSVGVILGLPGVFKQGGNQGFVAPSAYLVPLVILIPCWWGFFDKAKTITRIVGYFRILERIALIEKGKEVSGIEHFFGWENSVSEYRKAERTGWFEKLHYRRRVPIWEIVKAIFLVPSQRYWSLAHYTYLVLCLLCVLTAIMQRFDGYAAHASARA